MSDFIKSVVEEVMKPYGKSKVNPINGVSNQSPPSRQQGTKKNIPGITRPNYQKEKMNKRISVHHSVPVKTAEPHQNLKRQPVSHSAPKSSAKEKIAQLQTLSLVQGKHPVSSNAGFADIKPDRNARESQLIGQTPEGVKVWLFSELHPALESSFQRELKTASIGVVISEKCTPGQLFMLNDLLREFPSLRYCLTWDKNSGKSFSLELYEENHGILLNALKSFFKKLSQKSFKTTQIYREKSPSPWLTKQLGLNSSIGGVAVIEGIDYYSGILILDRYMKKSTSEHFNFLIEKKYLLLHGHYDDVSRISDQLHKEFARIN
ncbi:hypothetical protein [Cytobacillus oceanisediminis]|uniref:hypothetical protein n=1 Tax=Cytobacillus oceanisediminis TaxID=665099 RepID=UPI00203B8D06|nr:hypothetical protein [Cytobacillus oceanisediminis]MCM3245774.1 hypothetical protein [Cytobacillus oceanisediminis]MCM3404538.1 hypothetical protein [Cytobacillus oceanisediminis]MDK7668036.1 hypothetical protein [Cytobacillus oceanisediminis]